MVAAFQPRGNVTEKTIVEITQTRENFVLTKLAPTSSSLVKALVIAYLNHGNATEITTVSIMLMRRIVHLSHALLHNLSATR
jgi:hypothetical protein